MWDEVPKQLGNNPGRSQANKKKRVNLFTNRELGLAYFYRGYAYAKSNYLKLAIEDFDKAAKLNPLSFNRNMVKKLDGEIKYILNYFFLE